MLAKRIIPCLDVDRGRVVKGTNFVGLVDAGDPVEQAAFYDAEGADELIFLDITASSDGRDTMLDVVRRTAETVSIPFTIGGGIRTTDDMRTMLRSGADKVSINSAAVKEPELITRGAERFGTQCIVVAIETIRQTDGRWKAFTDNGREHTGLDAYDWAMRAVELGAGELLLTSVDREGTFKGFELEFIEKIAKQVPVPVVAHGGAGTLDDIVQVAKLGVDGVAIAGVLHYNRLTVKDIKQHLINNGVEVRA